MMGCRSTSPPRVRAWPPEWQRRMFVLSVAEVILVASFSWAALSGWGDRVCGEHGLACGVVSNAILTLTIGLGAYLYLIGIRRWWILREYLRTARDDPGRIFEVPPYGLGGLPVGIDRLYVQVVDELALQEDRGVATVVGDAGCGKTSFLLGLAHHLARRGAVPIPLSMRGRDGPVDLNALARDHLLSHIERRTRSHSEAENLWRALAFKGLAVVLADGLDELAPSSPKDRLDIARSALDVALRQGLRVVATSRPEGAPPGDEYPQFPVPELAEDKAGEYIKGRAKIVLERKGKILEAQKVEGVAELVRRADIVRTPFYLNVVADLAAANGVSDVVLSDDARRTRIELLNRYVDGIASRTISRHAAIHAREEDVIAMLPRVAGAMTSRRELESSMGSLREADSQLSERLQEEPIGLGNAVDDGERLGFVRTYSAGGDTRIRFTHAILQSFFLHRLFMAHGAAWDVLLELTSPNHPQEMLTALSMWTATEDRFRKEVSLRLRDDARSSSVEASLQVFVASLELTAPDEVDGTLDTVGEEAWRGSDRTIKLAVIPRIRSLELKWRSGFLYGRTRDPDYAARFAAAQAVAAGGVGSFRELRPRMERRLTFLKGASSQELRAELSPPKTWDDDSERRTFDAAVIGWLLPALVSAEADGRREPGDLLRDYIEVIEDEKTPMGLEASFAQGFKLDAMLHPSRPPSDEAIDLLAHARFWYSATVLLQAIARRGFAYPEARDRALTVVSDRSGGGEHPYVRKTAKLCERALKQSGSDEDGWRRFIWEDEAEVIARAANPLVPEATKLVADIVLLLTLIEQPRRVGVPVMGKAAEREAKLPRCLSRRGHRKEFQDGCLCDAKLCPYPTLAGTAAGRAPLSYGFCMHQASLARARSRSGSRRFWQQMASRVSRV